MVQQRIEVFRNLAQQVASEIVDRLCHEFGKEIAQVCPHDECECKEISRRVEPPAGLSSREERLDVMMSTMAEHHSNIAKFVHSAELEFSRIVNLLQQLDFPSCGQQPIKTRQALDSSWMPVLSPMITPRNHNDDDREEPLSPIAKVVNLSNVKISDSSWSAQQDTEHADISTRVLHIPSPPLSMHDWKRFSEQFLPAETIPLAAVHCVSAQDAANPGSDQNGLFSSCLTTYTQEHDETSMRVVNVLNASGISNGQEFNVVLASHEVDV